MPHSEIDRDKRIGQRRVSRFTFDQATSRLDLSREKELLKWPCRSTAAATRAAAWPSTRRATCTSSPATTTPQGFSGGYSGNNPPQPELQGRARFEDAPPHRRQHERPQRQDPPDQPRRTRRHVRPPTLPTGNLFTGRRPTRAAARHAREIYVMGVRNPARSAIDPETDVAVRRLGRPGRRARAPTWGPAKYENAAVITAGRQLRLAVLHGQQAALPRPRPAGPDEAAAGTTATTPKNDSPRNTGLDEPRRRPTPTNMWYAAGGGGSPASRRPADGDAPELRRDADLQRSRTWPAAAARRS